MRDPRLTKRILISFIYLCIFAIMGILLYYFFSPKATCFDKIKNQKEADIDCGGPCSPCKEIKETKDITVLEKAVVFGGNDSFDVVVRLQNPNDAFGASSFEYNMFLKDLEGNILAQQTGNSFILPAEKKYIQVLGIKTKDNKMPTIVEIEIKNLRWEVLSAIERPALNIYSKQYAPLQIGTGSVVQAILRNESPYDLNKVNVVVILRNAKGDVIGLSGTEKNTVRSREERDFRLTWPYAINDEVKNVDIEAYSNVFDLQNFIKAK